MRVLALEPYFGGSHQAFLDGWQACSCHDWTTLTLPARKWKWRMRHSAISFVDQLRSQHEGNSWDVIWASDMVNLAEFRGLAHASIGCLPAILYFHENQLTYPDMRHQERDYHFVLTNFVSAIAADQVWFNSDYHRTEFLGALKNHLVRMPDFQLTDQVDRIWSKSDIQPPGIHSFPCRPQRKTGPLRILWAARWENDKNPEAFFRVVQQLCAANAQFRLSVVGQSFRDVPKVFSAAKEKLVNHIDHWGYLESRSDYEQVLLNTDVVVSTAWHEFFGIAMVEAMAAGAFPLLPKKLAYPEILANATPHVAAKVFYDNDADLKNRLLELTQLVRKGSVWDDSEAEAIRECVSRHQWRIRAPEMDQMLADACK